MPSLRTISSCFVAAIAAATLASASPVAPPFSFENLVPRCGECEAKENPLPVLVHGVQDKIAPWADKLKNLPANECTPDTVSPIIKGMKDVLVEANAQLQVYVDAQVDLKLLLADAANSEVTVSIEAFAGILVGLVNVVVTACLSVLKLSVGVELDVIVKLLGDLCITLGLFIHLCLSLVVGLSASLMMQISAFVSLCVQLGVKVALQGVWGARLKIDYMALFEAPTNFSIAGGQFTNIGRDQRNVYNVNIHRLRHTRTQGKKSKPEIYDEFVKIPTGKIKLLDLVSSEETTTDPKSQSNEYLAHRTIHTARIAGQSDETFLRVSYRGSSARKAFEQDFLRFSRINSVNAQPSAIADRSLDVAQLYGYNDSNALPALIFYDALVPVNNVRIHHSYSVFLDIYLFSYNRVVGSQDQENTEICLASDCELWIQPRTSTLCAGPLGPRLDFEYIMYQHAAKDNIVGPTLTMNQFEDVHFLRYHDQHLSDEDFLFALATFSRELNPVLPRAEEDLVVFPGSVFSTMKDRTAAMCPRLVVHWDFFVWPCSQNPSHSQVLEDGTIRFSFTHVEDVAKPQHLEFILHCREPKSKKEWSVYWLSQAHNIFSQLQVPEDDWKRHLIFSGNIRLTLEICPTKDISPEYPSLAQFCLFVRPVPLTSSGTIDLEAWMKGDLFYWSFDPTGPTTLAATENCSPPELKPQYSIVYKRWNHRIYDAVRRWQEFKGFDPATTAFAQSLGHPIMEIKDMGQLQDPKDSGRDADWELEMALRGL
ncbi:hypothetical protein VNI00_007081 [Paramarasmius palmivorus]|uniref:Uncharacterized protein n=1 Tax=Paramarasmius palmivorus TaxID=297713 RepID=A0AAW0D491_9AGAR